MQHFEILTLLRYCAAQVTMLPTFRDSAFVAFSGVKMFKKNDFDPSRWDRYTLPKRWLQSDLPCPTTQKTEQLISKSVILYNTAQH
jgi:hypothetical protein